MQHVRMHYVYMYVYTFMCINICTCIRMCTVCVCTVYPEMLAVIKFGNLPEILQKCIIGGI